MSASDQFSENQMPLFEGQELFFIGPKGVELSYVKDHRQRLHHHFAESGELRILGYELLELVLFRSLPKGDINPVARRLIDTFSDINGVISARPEHLAKVCGLSDLVITDLKILEATSHRMALTQVIQIDLLSSWGALINYYHTAMSNGDTEVFRCLFFDRKDVLIADEEQEPRTVFVNKQLAQALSNYQQYTRYTDAAAPLFSSQKGGHFSANTICQLFLNIFHGCGLQDASSHSPRRTFITRLANKGIGVRVLAKLGRHSSISVTQRCIDVNDEQMANAVELL